MNGLWRNRLPGRWTQSASSTQPARFDAELRSCHRHIAFDATFEFWWRTDDEAGYWPKRQTVTDWADEVSSRYCVTQAGNAEVEINTQNPIGALVKLTVSPEARAAAEAIQEVDRQADLTSRKRQVELEQVRYLRENIYSRPNVARSYWLYHHPDQINTMLDINFEEIAEKFTDVEESRSLAIARLLGDFLAKIEDVDRRHLIGQLGQVFSSYNRPDLATRLDGAH